MFDAGASTVTELLLKKVFFGCLVIITLGLILGGQTNKSFAVYWAAPDVELSGITFQYGMWQGISKLWEDKIWGLSLLLFICSGLWPIAKLLGVGVLGLLPGHLLEAKQRQDILYTLCTLGRFSFVDVWVVSLIILTIRVDEEKLPGIGVQLWVQAVAQSGVVLFLFAIILSQTISFVLYGINQESGETTDLADGGFAVLSGDETEAEAQAQSRLTIQEQREQEGQDEQPTTNRSLVVFLSHDIRLHAHAHTIQIGVCVICLSAFIALFVPILRISYVADHTEFFVQDYSILTAFATIGYNRHPSSLVGNPSPGALGFFGILFVFLLPLAQIGLLSVMCFAKTNMAVHRRIAQVMDVVSHFASMDTFCLSLVVVSAEISSLLNKSDLSTYVQVSCAAQPAFFLVALAAVALTAAVRFICHQHARFVRYFTAQLPLPRKPLISEQQVV